MRQATGECASYTGKKRAGRGEINNRNQLRTMKRRWHLPPPPLYHENRSLSIIFVEYRKTSTHNGNELNERVDRLAKEARPTPFERVEGEQVELIPL